VALKVAIVGSGAVGLFYGTRLLQAGADVSFLMRSGFPEAKKSGIVVLTGGREEHFHPVQACASPEDIGPIDWCVVCLKSTDNQVLPQLLEPWRDTPARFLTLQNGLGNERFLHMTFPQHAVAGGLCFVCLNRTSPAAVRHLGHGKLLLGDYNSGRGDGHDAVSAELRQLAGLWQEAGVAAEVTPNLTEARWRKLVWNVPFNGLTIVEGGVGVDKILADERLRHRARRLMEEVRQTANRIGCAIGTEFIGEQFELTEPMGDYRPSSLLDFLAGRPVEWKAIWDEPLQQAKAAGVKTPELARLTEELARIVKTA